MGTPFLGEIKMISFGFAPRNWAFCNGQLLPINQNQALFSLLGTTYGGDGQVNFKLPDLRGRLPMHTSSQYPLGSWGGSYAHTLSTTELPAHQHMINGTNQRGDTTGPTGASLAVVADGYTAATAAGVSADGQATTIGSTTIGPTGLGQAHNNTMPSFALGFCICLVGQFPNHS